LSILTFRGEEEVSSRLKEMKRKKRKRLRE